MELVNLNLTIRFLAASFISKHDGPVIPKPKK